MILNFVLLYKDDSPPSIRIKVSTGSGTFEPSGVLAVLPGSTVFLDCMYPRRKGNPEWTWTGWRRTYKAGNFCYMYLYSQKSHFVLYENENEKKAFENILHPITIIVHQQ